ncbi:Serine/threonine protein kinase [Globisporangium polare]
MWKRLADRLMSVYLHFQEAPDSFRASGYPFVMILFHVVQSQRACSADNVTTRLVASPSIVSRFRDFHTDITFLERAVGPCLFDSKRLEWEKQCRSDESALLELFRENVEDAASLALSLNNEADQVEAATLLQHKLLAQGAMCTPELLQLLELFESRVLEIFNVAVPKIPEWFIPTHELDADVTTSSSDEIAAAAILRGRWLPNSAVVLGEYQMQRGEFMMNVERCCSLSHPNVAKVYGASHLRSPFTAVFESTSSTNLREYLSREENKPGLWQRLLEVALGLKYLIERGVIVTVLRCGDIWVGTDGVAKINTLGCLAAQANAERGVQHARWLAPEIIRGEPPTVGSAIFSLAMCAWEALTAEVPWGPREMDDVIASQVVRGFRPPRFEGMADTEFNLIERMWLSDSSKRPPPAIAVQRLQHIVDEQSSTDANHSQDQSEPAMSNIGTGILDLQHFEFYDLGASIPYFLETLEFKCDQCRESQDAVQHILKRLHAVFTVIQSQNQLPNDVAVAGYRELLMKFNKFLGNAYKASSVLLLIKSQKVSLQSNVFHRWLDELLELLAPATSDPVHIWIPEAPVYDNVPETDSGDEKHAASPGLSKAELNPVEQAPQAGPIKIRRFPCDRLNERFQELDFAAIEVVDSDGNASRLPWLMHTYDLKYDRKSPIGVGAFGEVYRATWLGTPVVVKFMGFEADGDAYSRDLFFHELRVWFPLSHPHVIKLYGACHIGKRFFACEYAGNGTLSKFLKHSTIASDIRYCWALLCQVACGLQYLHELNILHNDLKCDNVLISTDGTAKVTDFGLSCILNSAEVLVDPRKQGAQQWKSPESLRGDRLTLASDVYAFAMCILEAVTGEPPWGCNIVDAGVRYQIKNGNFPLQPSRLSKTQWKLIEMMCVSEPAQRVHISFVAEKLGEFSQQQQLVPSLEAAAVSDAP